MRLPEKKLLAEILKQSRCKKKALKHAMLRDKEIKRLISLPIEFRMKIKLILDRVRKSACIDDKSVEDWDEEEFDEDSEELEDDDSRRRLILWLQLYGRNVSREIEEEAADRLSTADDKQLAMEDLLVLAAATYLVGLAEAADLDYVWVTVRDDRVCAYCESLDGQVTDEKPPAHPRCRCTLMIQ